MATGFAKGAAARGKRIAFGDGSKIIWDHHSKEVFDHNPNIAIPGSERDHDLEWVPFHRGNRQYAKQIGNIRWQWNMAFKAPVGEFFFTKDELRYAEQFMPRGRKVVVIEPNVPAFKTVAPNKTWPRDRYNAVASDLFNAGHAVVQLVHHGSPVRLDRATQIGTPNFRTAAAMLQRAALVVCPEGGLHHAAAAVGTRAVVIFGGFIPPQVTGYDFHINLTGNATHFCGGLHTCNHCYAAMQSISAQEVTERALGVLNG
jgi:ADP-heptose:LPS heptosyltransferase